MITNLDDDFIDKIKEKYGHSISKINLSHNGLSCVKNIEKLSDCIEKLNLSGINPLIHLFILC